LALLVTCITLFHVFIDTFQSFLVLLHASFEVVVGLLLLLEDGVVVDLLQLPPVARHLLLDVHDEAVLEPDALVVFVLHQCVPDVIALYSAQKLFYVVSFH
jgi:hypothetical protein